MSKKVNDLIVLTGGKGTLEDRCLKSLSQAGDEVIVKLFEGEELSGKVRGVGQYTILIDDEQGGQVLVFKHAIKTLARCKSKSRWEKARERIVEKTASRADDKGEREGK